MRGGAAAITRVVVLTHNSNIFLQAEIDALAGEFDEVVVAAWEDSGPELRLPANARHLGSFGGFDQSRRQHLRRLLSPRFLGPFLRVGLHELRRRRSLRGWARFVWVSLLGAHIADLPGLRKALDSRQARTTLYSFWATEPAYPVPWLPKPSAGWVVRHHSADLYEWASGYLPLWSWIADTADLNLFVSEHGLSYALHKAPQLTGRAAVRVLGSWDGGAPPATEPELPTIVSCSSLAPVKRVPLLASALRALDRPVRWVHLGAGEQEAQVREILAGADHVRAELRGHVGHQQVLDFYRQTPVSVFVNVSDREGIAVSICEALSFDIPVVATAAGGTPEIIGAGHGTGLLLDLDADEREIAAAIGEVLDRGRGAFQARKFWRQHLDAERNAQQLAQWLAGSSWQR